MDLGKGRDTPSPSSSRRHKRHRHRPRGRDRHPPKKLDISVSGVAKFSDVEASDGEEFAPPKHLSPRSAAKYVKNKLKETAAKRKKKKKHHKKGKGKKRSESPKKKKKKKGKKKRGKKSDGFTSEEESGPRPQKPLGPGDQHYYPTPRSLFKKRCIFAAEAKPVVCSICDGIHYRTKRNFAANLKIIINVNRTLTEILNQMRNRMKKIDNNLAKVKKNLEYLEEMYEGVFRKVNRLIS